MNESHVPADERPTEARGTKRAEAVAKARGRANAAAIAALDRAREEAGGNVKLAQALNAVGVAITQQAICQWVVVPVARVLDFEKATGVPHYKLRPDIYPAPRRVRAAE